ncbi:hypothetical protein TNCV_278341 [Trichonephila clavipes]|nr:hypothetical protein TNCV_278341 [Trichonephila clavipes]
MHEWPDVIFSDEFRFSLLRQDSRIRVWWHCGERTLAQTFLVCYDPCLYPFLEPCETLHFSRIMHNSMLLVLYGPFLNRKMFGCCCGPHVPQISRQWKTSDLWLPNNWLITIQQSLRLMSCGIVSKLHEL